VGSRYGATVSAPVFQTVAQEVLEYLGVPHDQPLKTPKQTLARGAVPKATADDAPSENVGDLNAIFDEINNLPADDPLRKAAGNGATASATPTATAGEAGAPASALQPAAPAKPSRILALLPEKVLAAFAANSGTNSAMPNSASAVPRAPIVAPPVQARENGLVVIDAGRRVSVPSFAGDGLRDVVETASSLGLRVEPVGSGLAREQAPAAGTMVPLGTEVVVRFAR
jgi:cell division protein FtsI (penicillin-binding protein 3)